MRARLFFTSITCAFVAAANANTVTFTFLEHGHNVSLGSSDTFTESGITLTAKGFTTPGVGSTDLYAKYTSGDPTETGLGMVHDPEHEINTGNFVQLTLPTTPATTVESLTLGSIQTGESAKVYFTTTAGSLTGATLIQTVSHDATITIPSGDTTGYIDVTAGSGNVLIDSMVVYTPSVPDGGATLTLLGCAVTGLGLIRRKLS